MLIIFGYRTALWSTHSGFGVGIWIKNPPMPRLVSETSTYLPYDRRLNHCAIEAGLQVHTRLRHVSFGHFQKTVLMLFMGIIFNFIFDDLE